MGVTRTGQVSVLVAYFLVLLMHLPKRMRLPGLVLSMLVAGLMVLGSARMQERFALAFKETSSFEQDGEHTSVGARLKAWEFSVQLFEQSPWIGHGIGSYRRWPTSTFSDVSLSATSACASSHTTSSSSRRSKADWSEPAGVGWSF